MAKNQDGVNVVDAKKIEEVEKIEENKVEKVEEKQVAKAPSVAVSVDKAENAPVTKVKVRVIKDIPNLFIVNARYSALKDSTITIPEYAAQRLRESGYIQ